MTIATTTKNAPRAARKSSAVVVKSTDPNATGAVGIDAAVETLRQSAMRKRGIVAEDVATVTTLVANNSALPKGKVFEQLLEALGGKTNPVISNASLYRYATIGALITRHGLPITVDTVGAAYPLTEAGMTPARVAVENAKGAAVKTVEAFVKTAAKAAAAIDKTTPAKAVESSKGSDADKVTGTPQSPAAFVKSVQDAIGARSDWSAADLLKVAEGLAKTAATITAANTVEA